MKNNVSRSLVKIMVKKFLEDDILALSAQLAYSLLLAFFPFLIFLMSVVSYSIVKREYVFEFLKKVMPQSAYNLIHYNVMEAVQKSSGSFLSITIILAIWTASMGFNGLRKGINKSYNEMETRPYWKVQVISILCTIGLAFIIIIVLLVLVFGGLISKFIAHHLGITRVFYIFWHLLRYVIILAFMVLIFAAVYHYTPCKKLKWMEVLPGAIFTTLGWLIISYGFSFYVNRFANYSRLYGSIGAVIVLMVWLYLSSMIILLGGELNAALKRL